MSISGSLFSGVSGLRAQSTSMGIISDNIANAGTVGYKGSKAQFETLVTGAATRTSYNPGGVLSRPGMEVGKQGLLNASTIATDVGIQGAGFFAVSNTVNIKADGTIAGSAERNFTRAGSFRVDKNGVLVNTAGYALLGVQTNTKGVPNVSNASVLTLQPVSIGSVTGSASPTSELAIGANLPAVPSAPSNMSISGTVDPMSAINTSVLQGNAAQNYERMTIRSSSGKAYSMGVNLVKNTAAATSGSMEYIVYATDIEPHAGSPDPSTAGYAAGPPGSFVPGVSANGLEIGRITVSDKNLPTTFNLTNAVQFSDGSNFSPNFNVSNLRMGAASAAGGGDRIGPVEVDSQQVQTVVYDSLGVAHNITFEFSRINQYDTVNDSILTGTATPSSGAKAWSVKIVDMRVAGTGQVSVTFPLAAGGATGFPIWMDGSNADSADGATVSAGGGGTALTATLPGNSYIRFQANGTMEIAPSFLPTLPMTTGANDFGGATFTLNLGAPGQANGLTSYSDEFAVSFIKQNGIPYGFRNGVEIDKDGLVRITFDNGQSIPIYKLPIVTFANPNKLTAVSGNVFSESVESGSSLANYAGVGGSGTVSPATLEASTVDLAEEFTNMIVTQRNYSANAKTITTADEMLQEILSLKR